MFRQGDVLVERISKLPVNRKPVPRDSRRRIVLAEGEQTGHAHAISDEHCDLFQSEEEAGVTFLEVREAVAALKHDEHTQIDLPTGCYRVVRQREYHPAEIRRVAD